MRIFLTQRLFRKAMRQELEQMLENKTVARMVMAAFVDVPVESIAGSLVLERAAERSIRALAREISSPSSDLGRSGERGEGPGPTVKFNRYLHAWRMRHYGQKSYQSPQLS